MAYPPNTTTNHFSIAPAYIFKGKNIISRVKENIIHLGNCSLIVGRYTTLPLISTHLKTILRECKEIDIISKSYSPECSDNSLRSLTYLVKESKVNIVIGVGGGKALGMAKILAHYNKLPVFTTPISGITCAAWTALSNIYINQGVDISILDYSIIRTAPQRTLVASIGDFIAK